MADKIEDAISIIEEVERLGLRETAELLENREQLAGAEKVKALEIKERLENAIYDWYPEAKKGIPVCLARILFHVHRELDFDKVLYFLSLFGTSIKNMRNQSDYYSYAHMAVDVLRLGAGYYENKHYADLDLTDCRRTENLIDVAKQACFVEWDWRDETIDGVSEYKQNIYRGYLYGENRNPLEEQWCWHSTKRFFKNDRKFIHPNGFDKEFFDDELLPHLNDIQKSKNGLHAFLKEFQDCGKMDLHLTYLIIDYSFDNNLIEMRDAVADPGLRAEYRLYILLKFGQLKYVEAGRLYSHCINQIEREERLQRNGEMFWAHFFNDPYSKSNPGFDAMFDEGKERLERERLEKKISLLEGMDIDDFQRISLEMLRAGFENNTIKTDNPVFAVKNIQVMMVALAILASLLAEENMDPLELIQALADGVICNDAYLQITGEFIYKRPDAVISLVSPEAFMMDALNVLHRSKISPEDCEALTQQITKLISEES